MSEYAFPASASDEMVVDRLVSAVHDGDWEAVEAGVGAAKHRGLDSPGSYDVNVRDPGEVRVGEEFVGVIVHPNHGDTRDPTVRLNGETTYVRFPGKEPPSDLEFGDIVRCRLADRGRQSGKKHNFAVAVRYEE